MRAAGKVAGIGVFNGGFRGGLSSATPTAQSLRNVQRPVAATISSGKVSGGDVAEAHKATWEMVDDWEFAGGVDDLPAEPAEPMPRVVFGGAPSLEETKEATAELKDALDKYVTQDFDLFCCVCKFSIRLKCVIFLFGFDLIIFYFFSLFLDNDRFDRDGVFL